MAVFEEPNKWSHPLGNNSDIRTIPDDTPEDSGIASLQKLFQLINSKDIKSEGGKAVSRLDINSLFKLLGDSIYYLQQGGVFTYDPTFDYTVGRVVLYNWKLYKCIKENGASSVVVAPDLVSLETPGEDYWRNIENPGELSLILGQIVTSSIPLSDSKLHKKDGSLLSGDGIYSDFVNYMGKLHDSTRLKAYGKLFSTVDDDYIPALIYVKDSELSANTVLYDKNGEEFTGPDYKVSLVGDSYVVQYYYLGQYTQLDRVPDYDVPLINHEIFPNIEQTNSFSSPTLTGESPIGFDSFGIEASESSDEVTYPAWKILDGNSATGYVSTPAKNITITFYNPTPIVLTKIELINKTLVAGAITLTRFLIEGSDDNTEWTSLITIGNHPTYPDEELVEDSTWEVDLSNNNTRAYKYYRLRTIRSGESTVQWSVGGISLTGYYPVSEDDVWQELNDKYGYCDLYAYDPINNTLRLPKSNPDHGKLIKTDYQGTVWYRIYEDGFCEQGGHYDGGVDQWTTVTFPRSYSNLPTVNVTRFGAAGDDSAAADRRYCMARAVTATGFNAWGVWAGYKFMWRASGYTDVSDLQFTPTYEYIVVSTSTKTDIEVDIDKVSGDLNHKADLDLINTTPSSEFAKLLDKAGIRTVVETYRDGASWYRVYSDNWCEQGGMFIQGEWADRPVTLLKEYADDKYTLAFSGCGYTGQTYGLVIKQKTSSSFVSYGYNNTGLASWIACGYLKLKAD